MESVLDYATPPSTAGEELPPRKSLDWLNIILQIGHRAAALALFVVLITLAAIKTKYLEPHPIARIGFILSDLASLCAAGGLYFATVKRKPIGEALGLLIFSLIIAAAALVALLHT
jgi:hypothetical protein